MVDSLIVLIIGMGGTSRGGVGYVGGCLQKFGDVKIVLSFLNCYHLHEEMTTFTSFALNFVTH